ncbi:hypothetical protein KP509_18G078600 [Ceratopteris richardii]|uniref:Uncharacterized protein n=1 Tax=Ceratopteris richardii TaxID=49495 RepID=A0A8T2SSR0_CERRI|nr:hypothetical protein KP509_18G078600 [Ceratopteris richardii]
MEGFITRDRNIDLIQAPIKETDSLTKGPTDRCKDLQRKMDSKQMVGVIENDIYAHQMKRVQWNDHCGKELVQVHEYEASEIGEFEEDDDNADAHVCTCTIQ